MSRRLTMSISASSTLVSWPTSSRKQKCSLPFTSESIRIGADGEGEGDDDDDDDEEEALIFQESPAPADRPTPRCVVNEDPCPRVCCRRNPNSARSHSLARFDFRTAAATRLCSTPRRSTRD